MTCCLKINNCCEGCNIIAVREMIGVEGGQVTHQIRGGIVSHVSKEPIPPPPLERVSGDVIGAVRGSSVSNSFPVTHKPLKGNSSPNRSRDNRGGVCNEHSITLKLREVIREKL